jgi:hypothetical protein
MQNKKKLIKKGKSKIEKNISHHKKKDKMKDKFSKNGTNLSHS